MKRKDQTDRCSFLPDRIFGLNIRPFCKEHDEWYDKSSSLPEKIVGDFVLVYDLSKSGFTYAKKYKSESTSPVGRAVRKIGVSVVMPPLMVALGVLSLAGTLTVGTVKWLQTP